MTEPLKGKRILVTRAQSQASALANKILILGGEPVEFPAIELAPLEDFRELDSALRRIAEYDWVIFTSANGVRFVSERLRDLGMDAQALAAAHLAAIGPATAHTLQELDLRVGFVPTQYLGERVASELPVERGQRALLLRADIASDVLEKGLAARGVDVTNVHAYRTITPPKQDVDLGRIDAVTFTSSSTVHHCGALLGDGQSALANAAVFCIGPVTANTARELGLRVDAVAAEHTIDGLVNVMCEYYSSSSGITDADQRG